MRRTRTTFAHKYYDRRKMIAMKKSSSHSFSKQDIARLFTPINVRRGTTFKRQGRVVDLYYDAEANCWHAKVLGSRLYEVAAYIYNGGFDATCDCPAFARQWECKHIVAALLQLSDPSVRKDQQTEGMYRAADAFIKAFTQNEAVPSTGNGNDTRELLTVEYICKVQPPPNYMVGDATELLSVELKTGVKRPYVVKNITKFLDCVMNETTHYFTPRFSYDPMAHALRDEDREIFQILVDIARNEGVYQQKFSPYGYGSAGSDRELIIPPLVADRLFHKLQEGNSRLEYGGTTYQGFELVDDALPFSFLLEENGADKFQLDLSELATAAYFPLYGFVFNSGSFYKLSPQQQALMEELEHVVTMSREGRLPIAKTQIGPFLSHVAPGLKRIGQLDISDEVASHIVRPPLEAKVYVTDEEDVLRVKVEYAYGEWTVNPFADGAIGTDRAEDVQANGAILIRDAEKERGIMQAIERSPLKIKDKQLYLEKTDDKLYDFLYNVLPELAQKADVYTTDAVRSLMLPERSAPVTSVDLDGRGNLLEVSFDMVGIAEDDIQRILQSVVEKKKYYRLPDGPFVSLEGDDFEAVRQLFGAFDVPASKVSANGMQLPVYRGLQVDELVGRERQYAAKVGKAFRRLVQHLRHPDELDVEVPATLDAVLRDYQTTGFQWLKTLAHYRLGGILADDMGLGKTLQTIAYIVSEVEEGRAGGGKRLEGAPQELGLTSRRAGAGGIDPTGEHATNKEGATATAASAARVAPVLVVAPASLVYNWKNEFTKFAPELSVDVVVGTPAEREAMLTESQPPDVWITSYPLLRQDIEQYSAQTFSSLILDEAQAIKNHQTKAFKAVQKINAPRRFALSGTPIENSLDELWSIFQAIMPGFFPEPASFRKLAPEQVAKMVRPFILRRVKKDVLKELPDKIETVHWSELTKQQKELYLGYLDQIRQETKKSLSTDGFNKSRMKILAGLTRLRQLCCHPALFLENYTGESGKLEQLRELVDNALASGKRLLIFSQFTSMLEMIRAALAERQCAFFYLDGKTAAKERVDMAERFNAGERNVFLISLKAGGTGLNLTGADTVVLYDLWWNPAVEEQAAGRAHRIGQKRVVQVMRLIARGTIEEKIYEMQQKKRELIEQVIQPGETMLTRMTEAEIREILSI
nr:DEAD/DEAH box helicase [Numidum massiliense]